MSSISIYKKELETSQSSSTWLQLRDEHETIVYVGSCRTGREVG